MQRTHVTLSAAVSLAFWLSLSPAASAQSQYNDPVQREALRQQQIESRQNRNSRLDYQRAVPTVTSNERADVPEQSIVQITTEDALLICEQQERFQAYYVSENQQQRLVIRLQKRTGLDEALITHLLTTTVQCARILDMFDTNSSQTESTEQVSEEADEGISTMPATDTRVSRYSAAGTDYQSASSLFSIASASSRNDSAESSVVSIVSSASAIADNTQISSSAASLAEAEYEAAYEKLAALCRIQARLDDEYNMEPTAVQTTAEQLALQWSIDTDVLISILNEPELCTNPNPLWLQSPLKPENGSASAPTAIGIIVLLTLFSIIGAYTLRRLQQKQ